MTDVSAMLEENFNEVVTLRRENRILEDNLTAVQTRCTELVNELRDLRAKYEGAAFLDAGDETIALTVSLDVHAERVRQERLKAQGKFRWTCADVRSSDVGITKVLHVEKLAVLAEEFGEVAREVCEATWAVNDVRLVRPASRQRLRSELIQVAAVAQAWAESLDREAREETP